MSFGKFEESIIKVIDKMEEVKQLIAQVDSSLEREQLIKELNKLKTLRAFYIEMLER